MDLAAAMAMTATLWLSLPHGDSAWDLLETVAPFAFTEPMNTGGTLTGVPLLVGSEASSWTQASFRIGLADVTDPSTGGRPLLYPDLSLLDGIHLTTSGTDLQSGAPGPVIALVPKVGRLGVGSVAGVRRFAIAVPGEGLQHHNAGCESALAGPRPGRSRRTVEHAAAPVRVRRRHVVVAFRPPGAVRVAGRRAVAGGASDLRDLAGPQRRSDGLGAADETAFGARALLQNRDAGATRSYGGVAGGWHSGGQRTVEVSGALSSGSLTPQVPSSSARGTVDRLVDDPIEALIGATGGSRTRGSIAATLTTGTTVRLNGGVSASGAVMHASPFGTGLIGETVAGIPARAWDYGLIGDSHRSETTFAMYGSADTRLFDTIDVNGGLRLEHVGASARGAASGISWTSLEPRAMLHYARGPWSGVLGARRYHPVLALTTLAAGDPAGP